MQVVSLLVAAVSKFSELVVRRVDYMADLHNHCVFNSGGAGAWPSFRMSHGSP